MPIRLVLLFTLALVLSIVARGESETVTVVGEPASKSGLRIQPGGGLVFYPGSVSANLNSGRVGYQATLSAAARLTEDVPLYIGIDVAFMRWNFDPYGGVNVLRQRGNARGVSREAYANAAQLLVTGYYMFEISSIIRPYVGVSVGPNLYTLHQSMSSTTGNFGQSRTETRTFFQLMGRIGADFVASDTISINLEPKIGILDSFVLFAPQASVTITL